MRSDQRIVTKAPLEELWDTSGRVDATRGRALSVEDIAAHLRAGRVRFVIADLGKPPRWIPLSDAFEVWKRELKPHLVAPTVAETGFRLSDFPGEYAYVATEWREAESDSPILLFECHH